MLRTALTFALATAVLALSAGSAHAVVGGERIAPSSAPWFVGVGICGGTLIAPDRVVTAAPCVDPIDYSILERIRVGTETRRGIRVSLPPTWRRQVDGFALDDIAIVQLDRPVTSVEPAALPAPGARAPKRVRIVGRGQIHAPARGKRAAAGLYPLRQATLASLSDAACRRTWRGSASRYRTRFEEPLMLCATDVGPATPFSSVCAGDSGGPLTSGTLRRPVLLGVISWTGTRCGADGLPSVMAEVDHYRAFLTAPAPDWAPLPSGPATPVGDARVGGSLTCVPPAWEVAPDELEYRWLRRVRTETAYELRKVGVGATYAPVAADRGNLVGCQVLGSNRGGRAQAPDAPESSVRVAA